jgi:sulfatase modifying factor 1
MRSFTVFCLLVSSLPANAESKKYALLVGINKYEHSDLSKLDYAEADVTELNKVLGQSGYETAILTGKRATLADIRKELDAILKKGKGASVVVVALAGHGIQPEAGKEAYFCPFDAGQKLFNGKADWDLNGSTLKLSEVIEHLKCCGAESKALLVDACRNDPKTGRGRGFGTNFNVGDLPDNLAVLLSCSKGEKAWEDKMWGEGHGAFFYHVLQGLNGKAAIEGHVSANTLAGYVKRAVKNDVSVVVGGGATQNPHTIINGDVDFLIVPAKVEQSNLGTKPPDAKVELKEPKPGEERTFDIGNGVKMKFCWIPGTNGKATLGSPRTEKERLDREAEHEVELDGFWLAKYTVTQAQYVKLTGKKNPSWFCADGAGKDKVQGLNTDDFPVEQVSWNDAQACIKSMKAPQGTKRVCLPSEAQWEWAARGGKGNGRAFYWGDVLNGDKANCNGVYPYGTETKGAYLDRTEKVGSYEAVARHPWGLCDMAGNVYQWCEDYYGEYAQLPRGNNPVQTVKQSEDLRVLRGGSWVYITWCCRCAYRNYFAPDDCVYSIGFRVAVLP